MFEMVRLSSELCSHTHHSGAEICFNKYIHFNSRASKFLDDFFKKEIKLWQKRTKRGNGTWKDTERHIHVVRDSIFH